MLLRRMSIGNEGPCDGRPVGQPRIELRIIRRKFRAVELNEPRRVVVGGIDVVGDGGEGVAEARRTGASGQLLERGETGRGQKSEEYRYPKDPGGNGGSQGRGVGDKLLCRFAGPPIRRSSDT